MEPITFNLEPLIQEYKENPYILNKLQTYLNNLPAMLVNDNKKYNERQTRINELIMEQDNFYQIFLSKNPYYYMHHNNIFYEYNGKTYSVIQEDDIQYNLLSTITDEGKLVQWKHKTKITLIKKIKERSLFTAIPETYTIQQILNFLQTIFYNKHEAKYFITILGDCILKKNTDNLFFIHPSMKKVIGLIDSISNITTGSTILNNFIVKYHDTHKISSYRLINTVDTFSLDMIKNTLNDIGVDLLCVAAHYSERYNNSNHFLLTYIDEPTRKHILYFENYSTEQIIDNFVAQCIEVNTADESHINWKNMHYIWKLYLQTNNIPNMIYATQLQTTLSNVLEHSTTEGSAILFNNITSKYLPNVSAVLTFWEKYITILAYEETSDEYAYEIDELVTLYKRNNNNKTNTVNETNMIKIIQHYFTPTVQIIDNKYITNIKCSLWVKHADIYVFLQNYSPTTHTKAKSAEETNLLSFDVLYHDYTNYIRAKSTVEKIDFFTVSKHFFETYLTIKLAPYIKFDKFVSSTWILHP